MRLSEVLSNPIANEFVQIESFINKKLSVGEQQKIDIGKIRMSFHCENCHDTCTFTSGENLFCIGVSPRIISIDSVLRCAGDCGSTVAMWFLLECQDDEDTDPDGRRVANYLSGSSPYVRILKRREKLSEQVRLSNGFYADFDELLDKAMYAYRDGLGAGAMVYLRKIFEKVTEQSALAVGIDINRQNGKRRPFKELIEEVDAQCHIIPAQFSENRYRLFGELSDVVHGESDENTALRKFEALHRLIISILDNVKTNRELTSAINSLGWNEDVGGSNNEHN